MAVSEAPAVRTACPYCGVGCGLLARRSADGSVTVAGDPDHPANRGRLCSKGSALPDTLSLEGRLLHTEIGGRRASWEEAIGLLARRFGEAIRQHGPDSVAFYVSGQLLTEDYYVANKLMKGWIGTANIDTNSRLCMASSVAGHRRAFGADIVPGCYADLEEADLVVLVGSNLAWCHPVLFQRLMGAREKRGTRIVAIDPRRTITAEAADLHLALAPGSDVALFNGLLAYLADAGAADAAFLRGHASGAEEALAAARALTPDGVAKATDLDTDLLARFYALFAATPCTVTVYSQGVNQSTSGTDKVNAILNCHLLTGRIGKPGAGPFSVTGQPNAMGGREVGGLANMLAAQMEIDNPGHRALVQAFWRSPAIAERPGLKAVELFRAVRDGRIKALWVMATNPADSLPEADEVAAALRDCPFLVVSDVVRDTDTTRHADLLLPAAAWGEKDGTVTNSERRISRQRRFLDPPGEARPDWWIVCQVARAMGFSGFDFQSPAEIFDEYCRLTSFRNDGARALDLSGLVGLGADGYAALEPVQWPARRPANSRLDTSKLAETFAVWDSGWYFDIASNGYYYSADGKLTRLANDIRGANGIMLSPDEKTMYVTNVEAGVLAFDVQPDATIRNRRPFVKPEGGQDGFSVDAAGKRLVLHLLAHAAHVHLVHTPAGLHQRAGHHEAGELVHRGERLLHGRDARDTRVVGVGEDGAAHLGVRGMGPVVLHRTKTRAVWEGSGHLLIGTNQFRDRDAGSQTVHQRLPTASTAPRPRAACAGSTLGVSAWIGVGGDRVKGSTFADLLPDLLRNWGPWEDYVASGEGDYDPDWGIPAELGNITSSSPPIVPSTQVTSGVRGGISRMPRTTRSSGQEALTTMATGQSAP